MTKMLCSYLINYTHENSLEKTQTMARLQNLCHTFLISNWELLCYVLLKMFELFWCQLFSLFRIRTSTIAIVPIVYKPTKIPATANR
ncbi:hypothetical protein XBI1_1620027 [Xenorhabdus bovienii str. Intermedium]|uniref:Uncharacterized protein n=1 Tax=Xenorhabdus bovienii str. Intermedium TaxID=1379677 RepID=A0A077QE60_XENBV|nr:hypothetical protein XBI1_1620027 [Xenorhabdus bovienii str. Intermedium]